MVASLDRKRLGQAVLWKARNISEAFSIRRLATIGKLTSGLPVTHSEKQIGSKFLPLAIGSEVIAVARTMGARCFRSGSWQRSGRPLG
jgi:hypothetical protein